MGNKNILKLTLANTNIEEVTSILNQKTGKKYTPEKLTELVNTNQIYFEDAIILAEILGYDLEFIDKN